MKTENNTYPGFNYAAEALSAFILCIDTFIIALKAGNVIHHTPKDITAFEHWLSKHNIRNIKNQLL